jgi:hypothetical protein
MAPLDQARATQLGNIEAKTGRSLPTLRKLILAQGSRRHSELREYAQRTFDLGYGDANALIQFAQQYDAELAADGQPLAPVAVLDVIYSGDKLDLRPIHDRLVEVIDGFGPYETVPKKGYVSLRRSKQFAMIGPATQTSIEIGLNLRDELASARAKPVPPGGMCQYKLRVAGLDEIDAELTDWLRRAHSNA